jgi:N utilization substance protein B
MIRARSQGREAALKALYQLDLSESLDHPSADAPIRDDDVTIDQARPFAEQLVSGVRKVREELDATLQEIASNWTLERMAVIDRNILRLGAYELLHCEDVPPAVAINEAILLAQKYSSKDSGGFVNGILDTLRTRSGREE